jgi:hypothetical protein
MLLLQRSLGDAAMFCTFKEILDQLHLRTGDGEQLSTFEMNKHVKVKISLKYEKCILICVSFTSRNSLTGC